MGTTKSIPPIPSIVTDGVDTALVSAAGRLLVDASGAAGGTEFAEDTPHTTGDLGGMVLAVRNDAGTGLAGDGDYIPLTTNAAGALYVTGGGGGVEYVEDAAAAANPTGTAQILVRQDTPATLVTTDGDNVARRGTNYGAAYTQIVSSTGSFIDSFGGGTQYTEDVASAADPVGNQTIARRRDALSTETTTDGDNTALNCTGKGELYVKHVDTIPATQSGTWNINNVSGTVSLPTGAATSANQTTEITSLQLIDDTVVVLGTDTYTEASSKGQTIGAVRRDADTTLVNTTNEWGPLQMDANGRLKVEAFSGETLPVSLTSTTITGTVAVTQSGTWDEVGINDSGNSITVDNGGTFVVQENGSALTALQLIDDIVYTDDTSTHATGTSKGALFMAAATPTDASVNANDIGAVAMTTDRKLHVSVQDALPAGTNAIGKLSSNDGVDIGDVTINNASGASAVNIQDGGNSITVDGTVTVTATNLDIHDLSAASDSVSVHGDVGIIDQLDLTNSNPAAVAIVDANGDQITSFGGGTQYTEDAVAAADPVGTVPILVRKDTPATITTTDGDNVAQRGTNYGAAYVQVVSSSGGFIDSFGGSGGTAMTDDGAFTVGTTTFTPVGGTYKSTRDSVDDNDGGAFAMTQKRAALTCIETPLGDSAMDDTNDAVRVNIVAGSGSGTEYTEDAASAADPVGGQVILRRRDSLSTETTTDGDNTAANCTGKGELYVKHVDAIPVTDNAGSLTVDGTVSVTGVSTLAEQQTQTTALQLIDDIVYTDDTSTHSTGTSKGALFMAAATPTDASVNANDIGAVAMTTDRKLHVAVMDALPAGTNGIGKLTANSGVDIGDVDVTSVIPGTGATNLGKAEDGGHTTADVGVFALGVRNDTPNTAVTSADADYGQISTYCTGAIRVIPCEEDFAALGSNHVKKYYTNAGAVTDGIVWSPASGKRWYVTDISINVSAAATVTLEDDLVAGDSAVWKAELAANSGWSHSFATPLFSGEDAADLLVTTSAGNIYIMVTGYEI